MLLFSPVWLGLVWFWVWWGFFLFFILSFFFSPPCSVCACGSPCTDEELYRKFAAAVVIQ